MNHVEPRLKPFFVYSDFEPNPMDQVDGLVSGAFADLKDLLSQIQTVERLKSTQQDLAYLRNSIQKMGESEPEFKGKIAIFDPSVFTRIPQLVIQNIINSKNSISQVNVPPFLSKYAERLDSLRQERITPLIGKPLIEYKRRSNTLSYELSRDKNFLELIEVAMKQNAAFQMSIKYPRSL